MIDFNHFKRYITEILCDIKELKATAIKKIAVAFNSIIIEDNVSTINFEGSSVTSVVTDNNNKTTVTINDNLIVRDEGTIIDGDVVEIDFIGLGVDVTQDEAGKITVNISDSNQMQSDWTESDIDSPSYILNKPIIPDEKFLIVQDEGVDIESDTLKINFTGLDVDSIQTSPSEVEVNIEVPVSSLERNTTVRLNDGLYSSPFDQDGLISGGIVTWDTGYTFDVSAATYRINSVLYQTPTQKVTLSASDLTDGRFDVIAVDVNSDVVVIEGTPLPIPLDPSIDPETQIKLTSILVSAATTEPVVISQDWIYRENIEWVGSADNPTNVTFNNTDDPFAGVLNIKGYLTPAAPSFKFTRGSTTNTNLYDVLVFKIYPTAPRSYKNHLIIEFFNGATLVGKKINLISGAYGFDDKLAEYQHIAIPLADFNLSGSNIIDTIKFRRNSGGILTYANVYMDEIQLINSNVEQPLINIPLVVRDEGVVVDLNVNQINFTGSGVTATQDILGKVTVNVTGGGGSITADNGVNMSTATNVQIGGPLILETTVIGQYTDANAQANTTYDTEIGKYFYRDALNTAKYNSDIVSIQGATAAEGTKSVHSQEVINYATQTNSTELSKLYIDFGANRLVGESSLQLYKNKVTDGYSLSKMDRLDNGMNTEYFDDSIIMNHAITRNLKDIYYEDINSDFVESYDDFQFSKVAGAITGSIRKENSVYIKDNGYGTSFVGNLTSGIFNIYAYGIAAFSDISTSADLSTAGYKFTHSDGTDTLSIVNPTTLASGNITQFLPISVNGNFADAAGDITIAGGNPAWELLGNTGTDDTVNFLGTTDGEKLVVKTNNIGRFAFEHTYTALTPIGNSTHIASGNDTIPASNGNIGIGIEGSKAFGLALSGNYNNIAIGISAGNKAEGHDNILIGVQAGLQYGTGNYNVGIGYRTMYGYGTGTGASVYLNQNTTLGHSTMVNARSADGNVAIGAGALQYGLEPNNNVGVGQFALSVASSPSVVGANVAMGNAAASLLTTGVCNVVIGGTQATSTNRAVVDADSDNVYIGENAGGERGGGNKNTVIGSKAGAYGVVSGGRMRGEGNVLLGYAVYSLPNTMNHSVLIGTRVSPVDANGSGQLNIGNVLYGLNLYSNSATNSNTPTATGKIGIRTNTPTNTLHIYSEADNTSGLRLERLTSSSPTSTGQAIGVDASGNVVTVAAGAPSTTSILNYVEKTAIYTFNPAADYTVNCTANTFNLTLPTAVGITGQIFVAKNVGAGVITLNTTSSQTIDGALTITINQYQAVKVQSTGANWIIL